MSFARNWPRRSLRVLRKFDAHDPIRDFFNAADPLSCGAQIVIYANANTSRETRSRFDQQFAGFSTIALSRLMGLVDEAPPGSSPLSGGQAQRR